MYSDKFESAHTSLLIFFFIFNPEDDRAFAKPARWTGTRGVLKVRLDPVSHSKFQIVNFLVSPSTVIPITV